MDNYRINIILMISAAILMGVHLLAGLLPIDSLWGFNHLRYLNQPLKTAIIIIFVAGLVPSLNNKISNVIRKLSTVWIQAPRTVKIITIIILAGLLFYLLRVHVHSLGDGYQRIYQIEQGYTYIYSEPLDFFLHSAVYKLLNLLTKIGGEEVYGFFSIVIGVIFVLTIALFRLPEPFKNKAGLFKLLLLTFGGSQLFFGYVESYGLYYIFSIIYVMYALRYYYEDSHLKSMILFLLLALISHMTALILIPSFLYLIYIKYKRADKKIGPILLPLLVGLAPVFAYVIQEIWLRTYVAEFVPSLGGGILPVFSAGEYSILSPIHILDIINEFLLIFPAGILLIVALLFIERQSQQEVPGLFIWLLLIPAFLKIMLIDPKLGYARDWDLFAAPAAIIGLGLIIMVLPRLYPDIKSKYSPILLGSFSVLFFSGWILVNALPSTQLQRAEEVLYLSEKGRGYSTELLARYYQFEDGDTRKAIELLESIEGPAKNARVYQKIGKAYMEINEFAGAAEAFENAVDLDSTFAQLHFFLGMTRLHMNMPEEALPHLIKSSIMEPDRYNIHFYIGNTYFLLDSLRLSGLAFRNCVARNPGYAPAYFSAANIYRLMNKYDSAYYFVEQGMRLNPSFPDGVELYNIIKQGLDSVYRER